MCTDGIVTAAKARLEKRCLHITEILRLVKRHIVISQTFSLAPIHSVAGVQAGCTPESSESIPSQHALEALSRLLLRCVYSPGQATEPHFVELIYHFCMIYLSHRRD
jgi:hypothetical protein